MPLSHSEATAFRLEVFDEHRQKSSSNKTSQVLGVQRWETVLGGGGVKRSHAGVMLCVSEAFINYQTFNVCSSALKLCPQLRSSANSHDILSRKF